MVTVIAADHVLPCDGAPIRDGAVVVDAAGTILDLGRAGDIVPKHAGAEVAHVRGVVLPGLVNAHTHLELSSMEGKVRGGAGFVPWVDQLVGLRHESSAEEDASAIGRAVAFLDQSCTAAVGEVTNTLAAVPALAERKIAGCIFHEIFGLDRETVLRRVEGLRSEVTERVAVWPSRDLAYAPAPHTLYTLHPDAVRAILSLVRKNGGRTSLHLAEHAAERQAIEQGAGPLPDWLYLRTKRKPDWARKPLFDFASDLDVFSPDVLLVHLTDATPSELGRIAETNAPVVLCPRSNLHIEGRLPRLAAILAAGIAPALGTDSLASSPSLDVLAEARVLADHAPDVAPWKLLAMATWNGARALGRKDLGRLSPGARPGIVAVDGDIEGDPAAFLLANLTAARRYVCPRTMETVK